MKIFLLINSLYLLLFSFVVESKGQEILYLKSDSSFTEIKQFGFTLKEIEILKDLADQKTNRKIANKHFVFQNKVKYHIKNIFLKLEVKNRKDTSDKYLNSSVEN